MLQEILLSTHRDMIITEKKIEKAKKVGKAALICNIVVVIMNVVFYILVGIMTIVLISLAATGKLYNYNYGSYYYCYQNGYCY